MIFSPPKVIARLSKHSDTFIVSVLGQDEGYTFKYNPLSEGVPEGEARGTPEGKGLYLTVYPELSPNTDIISF